MLTLLWSRINEGYQEIEGKSWPFYCQASNYKAVALYTFCKYGVEMEKTLICLVLYCPRFQTSSVRDLLKLALRIGHRMCFGSYSLLSECLSES